MAITVSGTTLTFNDSTTQTTAGLTSAVTSVATGNGLSGGTITTTGTLVIAAPSNASVGAYAICAFPTSSSGTYTPGSTQAGSGARQNTITSVAAANGNNPGYTGTWRCCGYAPLSYDCGNGQNINYNTLWVRIS
jgi:hypothetical protein